MLSRRHNGLVKYDKESGDKGFLLGLLCCEGPLKFHSITLQSVWGHCCYANFLPFIVSLFKEMLFQVKHTDAYNKLKQYN